ncbi:hypothetical protein ACVWWO_008860 [Bradyrhizobium sp. F1.13.1]
MLAALFRQEQGGLIRLAKHRGSAAEDFARVPRWVTVRGRRMVSKILKSVSAVGKSRRFSARCGRQARRLNLTFTRL